MNEAGTANVRRWTLRARSRFPAQAFPQPGPPRSTLAYNPEHDAGPSHGRPLPETTSGLEGSGWRCREKGCVYPAAQRTVGVCLHHLHERREPALYLSLQPTGLLMDAARLLLPNTERDRSRQEDRRRLAAIREQFLEELA